MSASYFFRNLMLSFLALVVLSPPVLAQTTIDTTLGYNGTDLTGLLGKSPDSVAFGQTFIAPNDAYLTDFTFYLKTYTGMSVTAKAFVYAWTQDTTSGHTVGNLLFASPVSLTVTNTDSLQPYQFNTSHTLLTPRQKYVLALRIYLKKQVDY